MPPKRRRVQRVIEDDYVPSQPLPDDIVNLDDLLPCSPLSQETRASTVKRAVRRKSKVWQCYDLTNGVARCLLPVEGRLPVQFCKHRLAHSGSTSDMIHHLERCHADVWRFVL